MKRKNWSRWYTLLTLCCFVSIGLLFYGAQRFLANEDAGHMNLTVVNSTPTTISDAGFEDFHNKRVLSVGRDIAAGEKRTRSIDYNVNWIPSAISFDQAGQTLRIPLDGKGIDYEADYVITILPDRVLVECIDSRKQLTHFDQVPTTQKIN